MDKQNQSSFLFNLIDFWLGKSSRKNGIFTVMLTVREKLDQNFYPPPTSLREGESYLYLVGGGVMPCCTPKNFKPNVGLEPTTLGLKVPCSTN